MASLDFPSDEDHFECVACSGVHGIFGTCAAAPAVITQEEEEAYNEMFLKEPPAEDEFDLYNHFGIPTDVPEWQQEAMLEAAMGSG